MKLAEIVARMLARQALDRATERARRNRAIALMLLIPGVPFFLFLSVIFVALMALIALIAGADSGGCGNTSPTVTPATNVSTSASEEKTAGAFVKYFESQGMSGNAAAGITGNLQQESQLKANGYVPGVGGGLAESQPAWYAQMASYATAHGQSSTSDAGQLEYIVFDARTSYAPLLAQMNASSSPETAATMWETEYEKCQGVIGPMQVTPGSACNDPARRQYALDALKAAGGSTSAIPAAAYTSGQCVLAGSGIVSKAGYTNPVIHLTPLVPERIDMGVDFSGTGPIVAIGGGTIVNACSGGCGWPGGTFILEQLTEGAYAGKYWYVAECITPTVRTGQQVQPGTQVGTVTACGSGIEIGWASGTGTSTLAQATGQASTGSDTPTAAGLSADRLLVSLGVPKAPNFSIPPLGKNPSGYP